VSVQTLKNSLSLMLFKNWMQDVGIPKADDMIILKQIATAIEG
jgi:hypothetical protein